MPVQSTTTQSLRTDQVPPDISPRRLACVIPCFNEALVLRDTIASVLAAGLPAGDVVVVDDCSSDGTALIAESLHVHVLRNRNNLGKAKSIARGIDELRRLGRHDYVSVLDADTLVDSNYFARVVQTFDADADVVLVCGQPRSRRHNWLTAYRAVEYALAHGIYKQAQHKMSAITVAPGCASTYRMTVLEHLEWNPRILTEDADTTVQVYRKRLGRVVYDRRAVVHTQDPGTLPALKGQLRRWYTGFWQVVVCHRIPFGGQRLDAEFALLATEALLFSMLLLMAPVWLFTRPADAAYYFLIDQMICLAVACGVAIRQRRIDVVAYAPLFIVPRLLNCLIFAVTFVQIVVLRRNAVQWFSPPRYVSRSCGVLVVAALACSPAAAPLHAQGAPPEAAAPEPSEPATSFPGSSWVNSGYPSPLERGNLLTTYAFEQGLTLAKRGPHSVIPFAAVTITVDQQGLDWNNKVFSQFGVKYSRAFRNGVVQAGAGYAFERRFRSSRDAGQPIGFASYWFGWNPGLGGARSRKLWSSLPGTSWAAAGNHAPAERNNVIATIHVQQGITMATFGRVSLIPFVEHTLTWDSAGHPWNNRRTLGEGMKARMPVGGGVLEAAATYKHERRWSGGGSADGLAASVNLWYGWNPSRTRRER